jgi:hypothetical protein
LPTKYKNSIFYKIIYKIGIFCQKNQKYIFYKKNYKNGIYSKKTLLKCLFPKKKLKNAHFLKLILLMSFFAKKNKKLKFYKFCQQNIKIVIKIENIKNLKKL